MACEVRMQVRIAAIPADLANETTSFTRNA
jgi:hypothetical protein